MKTWVEATKRLSKEFYDGNVEYLKMFLDKLNTQAEV